jgi:hypothetical protein
MIFNVPPATGVCDAVALADADELEPPPPFLLELHALMATVATAATATTSWSLFLDIVNLPGTGNEALLVKLGWLFSAAEHPPLAAGGA